jgi:cytochrome P450
MTRNIMADRHQHQEALSDPSWIRVFDANSPTMRRNCGETYARMHAECPFGRSDRWGGHWIASTFSDIQDITRRRDAFSSAAGVLLPPVQGAPPLLPMESDPPEHDEYRRLLLPLFKPAAIASLEPLVRAFAQKLVADFAAAGSADLYAQLAKPLPMQLITRLLGIKPNPEFWEWVDILVYGRLVPQRENDAREVCAKILDLFRTEIAARRAGPGGEDVISVLLGGTVKGRPYTEDEVLDQCFFLLIAGLENTAFAIRAAIFHLAKFRAHREHLVANPSAIGGFIEECLRFYAPVTGLARTATQAGEMHGRSISADDKILLLFAAANRDPQVFPQSGIFDLERKGNRHIAFGAGPHRCLGSNLARLEIETGIRELLAVIQDFDLADPQTDWGVAGELLIKWSPVRAGQRVDARQD